MKKRLQQIAKNTINKSAIDIGADHGYLLIDLYNKGFDNLLGIEKNKGPYENCQKNLKRHNLSTKINCILSDGLKEVDIDQVSKYENIIIAGMGGDLILSIIKNDLEKFKFANIILQPNNNDYKLRKFLNDNNFLITDEQIILENNKYYEIIVCKYSNKTIEKLLEDELYFGMNHKQKTKEFYQKWKLEEQYLESLLLKLKHNNVEDIKKINNQLKKVKQKRRDLET